MRWVLSLQIAVGLAVLFGLGYVSVSKYAEPPAQALVERAARAEAAKAAGEVALAWNALRSAQEAVVRSASEGPVLASLGASATDGRETAIKVALEGLVAQSGGKGEALLIDASGNILGATRPGDGAVRLAQAAAVADALAGSTAARFERIGGSGVLVAATPILSGGTVTGALASTAPVDAARLSGWTGHLPLGVNLVLVAGAEVVASTLGGKLSSLPVQGDRSLELDGARYALDAQDLLDDGGPALKVFGLAKQDLAFAQTLTARVQFLVAVLGALSFFLVFAVLLLAPTPQASAEEAPLTRPDLGLAGLDPRLAPPAPEAPAVLPLPQAPLGAATPKFNFAAKEPAPAPRPAAEPPRSSPAQAYSTAAVEALPLAKKPGSGPTDGLGVPAAPRSTDAFDAIAQAAHAPPPPQPRRAPAPGLEDVRSDEDLPMPIEHMSNLPASRQPRPSERPQAAAPTAPPAKKPMSDAGRLPPRPVERPTPAQTPAVPLPPSQGAGGAQRWAAPAGTGGVAEHPSKNPAPVDGPSMRSVSATITNVNQPIPQFSAAPTSRPAPVTSPPVRDPVPFDEEHYRVVYNEFVGSKARLGEIVDNISFEGFSSKLRNSERELIERHGCKAVRFQVLVKDRQVSLRPQLVR